MNAIMAALAGRRRIGVEPGVGPELGCPPFGFGVFDDPHAAEFPALEVAALDLTLNGVACCVSLGGNFGGGEHAMTVTRLRGAAQLG